MAESADDTPEDVFFRELTGAYAEVRQAFADHVGMSRPRLQILMRLWRHGETSHSDLRQVLGLDGASVTRLVKGFEADGLVARRLDPRDNRYTLARLTPAGERTAAGLADAHRLYQARLLDGVPPRDRETVLRVLARLRANVRTHHDRRG
ncbi:MarR family winged helix-turn-helix transcriptional regulator [Nonomuraea rhodomycinica]|uniref:Winged helix-turn-helix transcriptional regulator n=1 Tax=Nonomuraea rhodomycinica TaxID=1712872 RepID=A0A7Y6ISE0_9ACTN|nr:MarR family winged helix-turn-helix transcriptional regulator [Nonomuraea rhodomycinica]NUW42279.1 winged helix-turn-helix transcriptional regulator [Nonomuraea rhodomycinica]